MLILALERLWATKSQRHQLATTTVYGCWQWIYHLLPALKHLWLWILPSVSPNLWMSLTPNQQSFYQMFLPDMKKDGISVKSDLHGESYEVEVKTPEFEVPCVNKIFRDDARIFFCCRHQRSHHGTCSVCAVCFSPTKTLCCSEPCITYRFFPQVICEFIIQIQKIDFASPFQLKL